jgi:hypothetical protein
MALADAIPRSLVRNMKVKSKISESHLEKFALAKEALPLAYRAACKQNRPSGSVEALETKGVSYSLERYITNYR